MPQVSKRKLDKGLEEEMFRQFWRSLGQINDSQKSAEFFSDLLTETEKTMLAKRFTAAVLITRGKTATEIKNSIHLTYSTVGSVSSWVKNAKPKTQDILTRISSDKNWEEILDRIDTLLDKLPPRYGTNWKDAGKEKYKRTIERSSRNVLR
jgi:uncharacterized protein YerC